MTGPRTSGGRGGPDQPSDERSGAEPPRDVRAELGRLVHDLQNPLSVISGNAEYLSMVASDRPDVAESARDIRDAAARLGAVIERLDALRNRLP